MFELDGDAGGEYMVRYTINMPYCSPIKDRKIVRAVSVVSAKRVLTEMLESILSDNSILVVNSIEYMGKEDVLTHVLIEVPD